MREIVVSSNYLNKIAFYTSWGADVVSTEVKSNYFSLVTLKYPFYIDFLWKNIRFVKMSKFMNHRKKLKKEIWKKL